ncbi:hypothetical protein [Nostoc commune]|uniref:hypothetical protein n=1 Tax=Nostoc commune TaxID=1178 RepID=UPI0018C47BAB|nr:hypothetical protein [Nostoc commune]MBG1258420.1 hypothetical protein [Nostoc commune BAE]
MSNPITRWIDTQIEKAEGKIHIPKSQEDPIDWHTTKDTLAQSKKYIEQTYTTDTKKRIQITVHEEPWE